MIIIYILLIIIAVGVLLASEAGRGLLRVLLTLAFIAGGLYLAFWTVVFAIAFFTSNAGKDFVSGVSQFFLPIMGSIILILILIWLYYGGKNLIKTLGDKDKRVKFWKGIKNGVKVFFIKEWRQHKIRTIFFMLSLIFFAIILIVAFRFWFFVVVMVITILLLMAFLFSKNK